MSGEVSQSQNNSAGHVNTLGKVDVGRGRDRNLG